MLSSEENGILTQVGPGTPVGQVMRRYWLPALLSTDIPAPDCPPGTGETFGRGAGGIP